MSEEIKSKVGYIYENFVMRDFTYVVSGSFILSSIVYSFWSYEEFLKTFSLIIDNTIFFIIVLIISYFTGLINQEFFKLIRVIKTTTTVPVSYKNYNSNFILVSDIENNFSFYTIRRLERIVFLKHIGAAIGSSSLVSFLIFLYPLCKFTRKIDIVISLLFFILTIICIIENRVKFTKNNEVLEDLAQKINKYSLNNGINNKE